MGPKTACNLADFTENVKNRFPFHFSVGIMSLDMKKRLLSILMIALMCPLLAFGSWSALYEGWEGHPRLGAGLIPTSLGAGLSFDWESGTSLYGLGWAGYKERMIWQDPVSGNLRTTNPPTYDYLGFSVELGVGQTLKDHSLSLGMRASYEMPFDSVIVGTALPSGIVTSLASWGATPAFGNLHAIMVTVEGHYRFDRYYDRRTSADGVLLAFGARYGLDGFASFDAEAKGAITLVSETEKDRNLFSVVLVDRLVASYDLGRPIPLSVQDRHAFGSKIRGFSPLQYPLSFSVANQLDLRFNGPALLLDSLFPRMTLFCDVGYGYGTLANGTAIAYGMLASSGVALSFTLGPFMDLGYQMAYLLQGENFANPGMKMVGELVAHLRF